MHLKRSEGGSRVKILKQKASCLSIKSHIWIDHSDITHQAQIFAKGSAWSSALAKGDWKRSCQTTIKAAVNLFTVHICLVVKSLYDVLIKLFSFKTKKVKHFFFILSKYRNTLTEPTLELNIRIHLFHTESIHFNFRGFEFWNYYFDFGKHLAVLQFLFFILELYLTLKIEHWHFPTTQTKWEIYISGNKCNVLLASRLVTPL